MIRWLYNATLTAAAPFAAVYLALAPGRRPLLARFRPPIPDGLSRGGGRPLWVQACSVGEVNVSAPIAKALRGRWPHIPLFMTASTVSGQQQAATQMQAWPRTYLPFDHPLCVAGFFERVQPRILVLVETELWPNLLQAARRRGIPVALVNGRLSDRHFPRYQRMGALLQPGLAGIRVAAMQSERDAERARQLGVDPAVVTVTGNTKFDGAPPPPSGDVLANLRSECRLTDNAPVVVFGSTRPGDEALAARCWEALRSSYPDGALIAAPRHVQRAGEAGKAFTGAVRFRSQMQMGHAKGAEEPVLILDTVGELTRFYALATVAVVGGSFYPGVGGHNPIEPAALGAPVVFGPHMGNFRDPARILLEAGGAVQVNEPDALPNVLARLLGDCEERIAMGRRARAAVDANRGAIARTMDHLAPLLDRDG
ncbi:MAG: 3-deoxy-D-manno-octulosonic acid transferase [Candidatus Hydrogenedentota bacterium]